MDALERRRAFRRIASGQDHVGAGPRERQRGLVAKAAGRAGDDDFSPRLVRDVVRAPRAHPLTPLPHLILACAVLREALEFRRHAIAFGKPRRLTAGGPSMLTPFPCEELPLLNLVRYLL